MHALFLFHLEVRPGGFESRLVLLGIKLHTGRHREWRQRRNRLVLNIRTTSGYTRGVTALGMALMNSIITVSAACLISFDYRDKADSMRDGNNWMHAMTYLEVAEWVCEVKRVAALVQLANE